MGKDYLSVKDVARKLDLSELTVRKMIKQGTLPSTRIGHNIRVKTSDLEAWLDGGGSK